MILHVITNFVASAGAETMLARLLRASNGSAVTVASLMDISDRNRNLAGANGIRYVSLGASSLASLATATYRLGTLIREERPSAVLCWMYHAMIAGSAAGQLARTPAPIFWNVRQSLDDVASLTRSSRTAIAIARRMSGWPAGIIYNSSRALKLHGEYGFKNLNATVIPNGFTLPEDCRAEPRSPVVFGIAARYHAQKDYPTFFRAAALAAQSHPHVRFIAAGAGLSRDNAEVVALMNETGAPLDRIELRGEVANMDAFYREIDALVLSSRTEGFPNVLAEAMSYCKPVIATDVGDAAAVTGDTGFIVKPRDPEALAAAMTRLLSLSPEQYATYAAKARSRIENEYALPAIAQKYFSFLEPI